jgi:GT2 family glycosyltransferase
MDTAQLESAAITVVIVLYEKAAQASEAFSSLRGILDTRPAWRERFKMLLYDNSPLPATNSDALPGALYVHDASNGGLSAAYNYALRQAQTNASEWLLLLDQDTTLTAEYVQALLEAAASQRSNHKVGAIVPLLELDNTIYSPEEDFFYHLRHQFPEMRYYRASPNMHGLQSRPLNAYNSGALLRVGAIETIGGFPGDFRVDYLDHAVFHLLNRAGYSLYVLSLKLQQKLSHVDLDSVSLARHTSVLQAQTLFVSRYGTFLDRLLFRLWLLRKSRPYRALCRDPEVWKGMVRQAVGRPATTAIAWLLDRRR